VGSSPVTSTSKPRRYGVSAFDEMPYLFFVTLRTLLRTLFPFLLFRSPFPRTHQGGLLGLPFLRLFIQLMLLHIYKKGDIME